MDFTCSFCPAMAVPMMVKIPEPITAPMPSDVRLTQPRVFFNRTSACSESESNWSMPLQRNKGDATRTLRFASDRRFVPPPDALCRWDYAPQCTLRGAVAQHWVPALNVLQLGVAFDELLRSAAGKTNGKPAILVITLDTDDSSNPVVWMADFLSKERIRIGATSGGRTRKPAR